MADSGYIQLPETVIQMFKGLFQEMKEANSYNPPSMAAMFGSVLKFILIITKQLPRLRN